jgi:metal-responsive CopG/Arc/MetJ family transcriptional regulator
MAMGRPSKGGRQVQVRLPEDEIEELEAWAAEVAASGAVGTGGTTRSDVIRDIVGKALRERKAQKGKAKR